MNQQVEMIISAFRTGVETILGMASDRSKVAGLEAAYQELLDLAEETGDDVMAFNMAAAERGLFNRLTEEQAKANAAIQEERERGDAAPTSDDTIRKQYEMLLEQARGREFATETVNAYEALLELDGDTAGEWLVEGHRRGLMTKIALMPQYDQAKLAHDRTDPNEVVARELAAKRMAIWHDAKEECDSAYAIARLDAQDVVVREKHEAITRGQISALVTALRQFYELKTETRDDIRRNRDQPHRIHAEHIYELKHQREMLRNRYQLLEELFQLDWERIHQTPRYWKDILGQRVLYSDTDRFHLFAHPENLDFYEEVLFEDILSDTELSAVVRRPQQHPPINVPPDNRIAADDVRDAVSQMVDSTVDMHEETLYFMTEEQKKDLRL